MARAVFLDRDGVLNRLVVRDGRGVSPRSVGEFELLPDVDACVEQLKDAGFLVVVVSNQPDVARGFLSASEMEQMHERLRQSVHVDAIYVCTHDDSDQCGCRKPKPGLLLQASRELRISLRASAMIGDSWKDVAAGRAAGCTTFLVTSNEEEAGIAGADFVVADLRTAADLIIGGRFGVDTLSGGR